MRFNKKATLRGLMLGLKESAVIIVNKGELLIEVVEVKGKYIRLCFQATKDIAIERKENACKDESNDE